MSISPDWSAVKRCCAVSGTYLTLVGSLRTAAATALHTSTSRPVQAPWLSAWEKPARPVFTPQTSCPRLLIASRVLPAYAGPATSALATASAVREILSWVFTGSPRDFFVGRKFRPSQFTTISPGVPQSCRQAVDGKVDAVLHALLGAARAVAAQQLQLQVVQRVEVREAVAD